MGYVLRLSELKSLIEDLIVLGLNVVVSATDGEVIFCVYLPNVSGICESCSVSSHSIPRTRLKRSTTRAV